MTAAETEKCVVASIRPEWCHKILSGQKLYEVRKNRPKMPTPFRCLIYCTKDKKNIFWNSTALMRPYRYIDDHSHNGSDRPLNGKVIAEFVCDEIKEYEYTQNHDGEWMYEIPTAIGEKTGMEYEQVAAYGGGKTLYLWHIANLKEYEKPLRLKEIGLKAAPQSWQYVILEE